MKKTYLAPLMELTVFATESILESNTGNGNGNLLPNNEGNTGNNNNSSFSPFGD